METSYEYIEEFVEELLTEDPDLVEEFVEEMYPYEYEEIYGTE